MKIFNLGFWFYFLLAITLAFFGISVISVSIITHLKFGSGDIGLGMFFGSTFLTCSIWLIVGEATKEIFNELKEGKAK